MNYDLAKELKDAVFPQLDRNWNNNFQLCVPTLEELIEACDIGNYKFQHVKWAPEPTVRELIPRWEAYGIERIPDSFLNRFGYGATPTEAVARLWLALNKKV